MMCEEFENRILADPENQLSADERTAVEKHLVECAGCQTLARQLQHLDAGLTTRVKAPRLSADFKQRLAKRIQTETTVLSDAQRAERKHQLQAEYDSNLKQLRRRPLRVTSLMDGLSYSFLAALAAWLAWQFTPELTNFLTAHGLSIFSQNLLLGLVSGTVFLALGLGAASPQLLRRLWSAI